MVRVAVDDTLCHKRGAKVAFGGIFLDTAEGAPVRGEPLVLVAALGRAVLAELWSRPSA